MDRSNGVYLVGFRSVTHERAPIRVDHDRADVLTSGYAIRDLKTKYRSCLNVDKVQTSEKLDEVNSILPVS